MQKDQGLSGDTLKAGGKEDKNRAREIRGGKGSQKTVTVEMFTMLILRK